MSSGIASVSRLATAQHADPKAERAAKIEKAAHEFESLLVKQLLNAAKITGEGKSGGYGDMAVDALSTGVEKAGGLGLAQRITEALSPPSAHHVTPPKGISR